MIDFNSNIIYETNGGATFLNDSIKMLRKYKENAVSTVVCVVNNDDYTNHMTEICRKFRELQYIAHGMRNDVTLLFGCRIMCSKYNIQSVVDNIKNETYPLLNNQYCLIMFSKKVKKDEVLYCVNVLIENRVKPIICNVENYYYLRDINTISDIKRVGGLIHVGCNHIKMMKMLLRNLLLNY